MKENRYDDAVFFRKYSEMDRSQKGLSAAGEWHALQKLLPPMAGARLLDLGCGYGWHCRWAISQEAAFATGVDISQKMLQTAREKTPPQQKDKIEYLQMPMEDIDFAPASFEVALSSLAFHYLETLGAVFHKVNRCLVPGGTFVFSMEHPIFTARGNQDWLYDENGNILCWPVDSYFTEGQRQAVFLGQPVTKYHHTLTGICAALSQSGFSLTALVEPQPSAEMLRTLPGMQDELRRPMMILFSAVKANP